MKAGFAKVNVNPPPGTRMMGFGARDRGPGSEAIRDDIFTRALYLSHAEEQAVILSFDMCFIGREDADRFKGVIGRQLDLTPRQILLNASHSHSGPASGYWAYGDYLPPEHLYLRELETAVVEAVTTARERADAVTVWAGMGHSAVPMNRRRPMADGRFEMRPNPEGITCDALPVCLLKDARTRPVACVFSASAHPSIVGDTTISAEYPGVAAGCIDAYLGADCSIFLQGCGGDAKTSVAGQVRDTFRSDWEVVENVGRMLGQEVIGVLETGMREFEPALHSALTETSWPLQPADHREFEQWAARLIPGAPPREQGIYELWGARQLELLERRGNLPTTASVLIQGMQLGRDLRLIAIEGEPVAEHGLHVLSFYDRGITFPLGYSNGEALYLPATRQLPEGGYEVESYPEYGYPSPLAPGMEDTVTRTLEGFKAKGIA